MRKRLKYMTIKGIYASRPRLERPPQCPPIHWGRHHTSRSLKYNGYTYQSNIELKVCYYVRFPKLRV